MPDEKLADPDAAGRVLQEDSDAILNRIDELRGIEEQKRHEVPTTPGFHELSERATETSRDVFRLAVQEDEHRADIQALEDHPPRRGEKPRPAAELESRTDG